MSILHTCYIFFNAYRAIRAKHRHSVRKRAACSKDRTVRHIQTVYEYQTLVCRVCRSCYVERRNSVFVLEERYQRHIPAREFKYHVVVYAVVAVKRYVRHFRCSHVWIVYGQPCICIMRTTRQRHLPILRAFVLVCINIVALHPFGTSVFRFGIGRRIGIGFGIYGVFRLGIYGIFRFIRVLRLYRTKRRIFFNRVYLIQSRRFTELSVQRNLTAEVVCWKRYSVVRLRSCAFAEFVFRSVVQVQNPYADCISRR